MLADILFEGVKHFCLWDKQTGEDEIRRLLTEYGIVKESNTILNTVAHSYKETLNSWRDKLNFIGISCEVLRDRYPLLEKVFGTLLKVCRHEEILPEQQKTFHSGLVARSSEIRDLIDNNKRVFSEIYELYLEDLSDNDIGEVKSQLPTGLFLRTKTECNSQVKKAVEDFKRNQLKTQLFSLWKEKTGTKNPREWSNHFRTPISLLCI